MEISANVHCLDLGSANCYLCLEESGLTLIDTGMPNQKDNIFNYLVRIGHSPAGLRRILITHADIDHAGSLAEIQAATGVPVYAAAETAAYLARGQGPPHLPRPVQFLANRFVRYTPVPAGMITLVTDGTVLPILDGLEVLATPGHTPDHHSFYSRAHGVLFAGDALNTRPGRVQLTPKAITADMAAARQSALRLLRLAPAVFACGHGQPLQSHNMDDLMALMHTLQ